MLKYDGYSIVLQEVPDEISLAFSITGCPWRCEGCHSKNLWEDTGRVLDDDIYGIIDEHRDEISCVLFMGGDHERRPPPAGAWRPLPHAAAPAAPRGPGWAAT